MAMVNNEIMLGDDMEEGIGNKPAKEKGYKKNSANALQMAQGNNSMLSQVVGIIIGSPEFQRR